MNYEFVDDFGNTWITDSALVSGPYLNLSSVGEANVRWFKERKDNYITHEVGWNITIDQEKKRINFNMEADALKEADFIIVEGDDRMNFVHKYTPHVSLIEEDFDLEDYNEMLDKVEEEWYHEGLHVYLTQVFVNKNTAHKNLIDAVRRLENNPFVDENLQEMWYERELGGIEDDDQDFRMR